MLAGAMGLADPTSEDLFDTAFSIAEGEPAVLRPVWPFHSSRRMQLQRLAGLLLSADPVQAADVHVRSWAGQAATATKLPGRLCRNECSPQAGVSSEPGMHWLCTSRQVLQEGPLHAGQQSWMDPDDPDQPRGEDDLPVIPMAEFLREAGQLRDGLQADCEALDQAITIR